MVTLWRWNRKNDRWEWAAECDEEKKRVILRGHKRRNPLGTIFRWTPDNYPPERKYRQRSVK